MNLAQEVQCLILSMQNLIPSREPAVLRQILFITLPININNYKNQAID